VVACADGVDKGAVALVEEGGLKAGNDYGSGIHFA
jgi:hypothetical protein